MAGRIAIERPGPMRPPGIGRGVQSFASCAKRPFNEWSLYQMRAQQIHGMAINERGLQ